MPSRQSNWPTTLKPFGRLFKPFGWPFRLCSWHIRLRSPLCGSIGHPLMFSRCPSLQLTTLKNSDGALGAANQILFNFFSLHIFSPFFPFPLFAFFPRFILFSTCTSIKSNSPWRRPWALAHLAKRVSQPSRHLADRRTEPLKEL